MCDQCKSGNDKTICVYCGFKIDTCANLCSECGSYQKKWKNELKYWSGVAGLLALLASGAAYTFTAGNKIFRSLTLPDIRVVDIDVFSVSAIMNLTSSQVFITGLEVSSSVGKSVHMYWNLSLPIGPEKVVKFELKNYNNQLGGYLKKIYSGELVDNYADRCKSQDFDSLLNENKFNYPYIVSFLYADGLTDRFLRNDHGGGACYSSCEMNVYYTRGTDGEQKVLSLPCRGYIRYQKEI
jgi:hypothetical protein